jgi:hypothetical protein
MSTTVPGKLVGAWRRESIQMEGEKPTEDSDVIWLQSHRYYGDIRIGLPIQNVEPKSFSGRVNWEAPKLTFHHDLDLDDDGLDVGTISWDGDVLLEDATFEEAGKLVKCKERWLRQTDLSPATHVFEQRAESGQLLGMLIEVGNHVVMMVAGESFNSAYWLIKNDQREKQWGLGELLDFTIPHSAVMGASYLINGSSWCCVESIDKCEFNGEEISSRRR